MRHTVLVGITLTLISCIASTSQASSLDTHPTGPGLSCSAPNRSSAKSDPMACTNTYEFSGYCVQGREGPGGNPYAKVEAGRAIYSVTDVWDGNARTATESISISGLYDPEHRGRDTGGAVVVSHCPSDPWMHSVSCTSDPVQWKGLAGETFKSYTNTRNIFPLTPNSTDRTRLRNMLFANAKPPLITSPTENQHVTGTPNVTIALEAGLPCGTGQTAQWVALDVQEWVTTPGSGGWDYSQWKERWTKKVDLHQNRGSIQLALEPGQWRVKAIMGMPETPVRIPSGDFRTFYVDGAKNKLMVLPKNLPHLELLPPMTPQIQQPSEGLEMPLTGSAPLTVNEPPGSLPAASYGFQFQRFIAKCGNRSSDSCWSAKMPSGNWSAVPGPTVSRTLDSAEFGGSHGWFRFKVAAKGSTGKPSPTAGWRSFCIENSSGVCPP